MAYWLIKSEPDAFSIDDLARVGTEPWTGVRNYTARNHMRDLLKVGDVAFFYHSSIAEPAIVGLARVSSLPYADPTQFDPTSEYFDPKSSPDNPRWILVDVEFVEKFPTPLLLSTLKADSRFAELMVTKKGMRLSVQPVSSEHATLLLSLTGARSVAGTPQES